MIDREGFKRLEGARLGEGELRVISWRGGNADNLDSKMLARRMVTLKTNGGVAREGGRGRRLSTPPEPTLCQKRRRVQQGELYYFETT